MVLAEPVQITQQIAQDFDLLNIRYFVGGSLASSLHGVPRATQDVDIVADIKYEHIPYLVKAFGTEFYISHIDNYLFKMNTIWQRPGNSIR